MPEHVNLLYCAGCGNTVAQRTNSQNIVTISDDN